MSAVSFSQIGAWWWTGLGFGAVLTLAGLGSGSGLLTLLGLSALLGFGARWWTLTREPGEVQPWPWPADFRALAEGMARPIDPTPVRVVPPDPMAAKIAHVATTPEALAALIAEKPPAWPLAVFTSVLVQRRNAVLPRLRRCVSGYQPHPDAAQWSGRSYAALAAKTLQDVADLVAQLEHFMLSPAFTGTIGPADEKVDPDGIVAIGHRLMDYHDRFLGLAEVCVQTPVVREALAFVQDTGAFTLCPLMGYEQFIPTMCARIAEAQELLPYTDPDTVIALDSATLTMALPDGLTERVVAHIKRFTA